MASTFSMPRILFKMRVANGFTVDIFGDDHEFALAELYELLEQGNDVLRRRRSSCRRSHIASLITASI